MNLKPMISQNRSNGNGQLNLQLWEILTRESLSTHDVVSDLMPKLSKKCQRQTIVQQLNRRVAKGEDFEISTLEGLWIARPIGKTETGRYVWDLYFRPAPRMSA